MALYYKWDVKNGFAAVLQFFSLTSDGLGGVKGVFLIFRPDEYHRHNNIRLEIK